MNSGLCCEYIREQKRYTQNELCLKFQCSEKEALSIIRRLKEFGVLKVVKASTDQKDMSELLEEDIEIAAVESDQNELYYVFTFVGVIVVAGHVLNCYPKYLLKNEIHEKEFSQVLQVLKKYNRNKEQIVRMFDDINENSSFNILAVLLFLIQDYYENGVYSNTEDIIESNGSGEIQWDKTINETFTFIKNNRPYYIDLRTKKRVTDEYDYFKRLHECILTKASRELEKAKLLDVFDLTGIELSEEELDDFGEKEYILYRIEKELSTQFNTRKQLILKVIYTYIDKKKHLLDVECCSLYGTNNFNLVWEDVCADILDNQLDKYLSDLCVQTQVDENYTILKNFKLKDLIEKPLWTACDKTANDTLVPDLISIWNNEFFIFDAKYYNAKIEKGKTPTGQPGIESITKQYLYNLAYKDFIKSYGFKNVVNCFLFPAAKKDTESSDEGVSDKECAEKNDIILIDNEGNAFGGEVQMKMFKKLELPDIKVRFLIPEKAYAYYLTGKKVDISLLKLNE